MTDFSAYVRAGWRLCMIDAGKKAPTYPSWNTKPIDEDMASVIPGAGLLHALSGTAALDIDNLSLATGWLEARGVDLSTMLTADDAVMVSSGRPNRAKLLYKLSKPMRTFKPEHSGIELRCATIEGRSVQDVLPGSIHPDTGKAYEWVTGILGDWQDLPAIPATLLALWRELADPVKVAPAEGATTRPKEPMKELRRLLKGRDPNSGYDDWLKVGMALHDATGGAREGLELWDEWSKGSPKYKSWDDLFSHYTSFSSTGKGAIVTGGSLKKDNEVADPDDFDVITEADTRAASAAAVDDEERVRLSAKERVAEAERLLTERLIYVENSERYFDKTGHRLVGTDNALEHQFTRLLPRGSKSPLNPVRILKASTKVRTVSALAFHPGEAVTFTFGPDEFANTYRDRRPAPLEPTPAELEKIEWLFGRLQDDAFAKWLKQFYGHIVQRPALKIRSAPLIWSDMTGNGKSTLIKDIPALLVGSVYSTDITYDTLCNPFTDYLQSAWHINLVEFRASTKSERSLITNKVKPWITDSTVDVHPKGKAKYTMPNHAFVTASSNEEDAANLGDSDRRWAVHEHPGARMTPAEIAWIHDDFLSTPRAAAVLRHYFSNVDLTGFNPAANAPETKARTAMIESSQGNDVVSLTLMFEEREAPFDKDIVRMRDLENTVAHTGWGRYLNAIKLGKLLKKKPFNGVLRQYRRAAGAVVRITILRNHEKWLTASGREIDSYLDGEINVDTIDDPLLS